jgi:hypothetical protein
MEGSYEDRGEFMGVRKVDIHILSASSRRITY